MWEIPGHSPPSVSYRGWGTWDFPSCFCPQALLTFALYMYLYYFTWGSCILPCPLENHDTVQKLLAPSLWSAAWWLLLICLTGSKNTDHFMLIFKLLALKDTTILWLYSWFIGTPGLLLQKCFSKCSYDLSWFPTTWDSCDRHPHICWKLAGHKCFRECSATVEESPYLVSIL